MEENNLNDLIHAFAAGCLDDNELRLFLNHPESAEFNTVELGELQNVISLLPAILELEYPQLNIKDKVAQKLYKFREEIKERKKSITIVPPELEKQIEPEIIEEVSQSKKEIEEAPEAERSYEKALVDEIQFKELQERIEEEIEELPSIKDVDFVESEKPVKKMLYEPLPAGNLELVLPKPQKESKLGLILLIVILFLLSLSAAGIVYYLMNKEVQSNRKQIASLNGEIVAVNSEISRLNKIQRILSILGSKDIWTINLNGTVSNPTGFGKLVIDYQAKEGLLQLYNMPLLQPKQYYQLWLMSKGSAYSLGTYKPRRTVEYLPVSQIPEIPQGEIESFVVTIEEGEGALTPLGIQYLSTTFQQTTKGNR
ncbi:MAG: anti-sigma factor [Ignavibacteriales bacterium]|nr:anti-sigma factor [Ignavibacteriales bacterium]